jgi:hypothetical protein
MLSHVSSIAHVQAACGTFVVPAQSRYERQLLREHVEMLSGRVPTLTVGMDGTRWIVTRQTAVDSRCGRCTQALGRLRCRRGDERTSTCIECAIPADGAAGARHGV